MTRRKPDPMAVDALVTNAGTAPRDDGEPFDPIAHADAVFVHGCERAEHAGPCSPTGIRDVEVGDGPVHNREREAYPAAPRERCGATHPMHGPCFRRAGHHVYSKWHQSPSDGGRSDVSWDDDGGVASPAEASGPTPAALTEAIRDARAQVAMWTDDVERTIRERDRHAILLARAIDAKARAVGAGALVTIDGAILRATKPRKRKGAPEDAAVLWTLEAVEVAS